MSKSKSLAERAREQGKTVFLEHGGMNRATRRGRTKKLLVLGPPPKARPSLPVEYVKISRPVVAEKGGDGKLFFPPPSAGLKFANWLRRTRAQIRAYARKLMWWQKRGIA